MPPDDSQRRVFEFLRDRLRDQQAFSKEELRAVTNWSANAFRTYWSKQFQHFMVEARNGRYRVAESFRPYITWVQFRSHVTQMRRPPGVAAYERHEYELVRIFEFYLPLTHEHALKNTLDGLFFKDIIVPKLRAIGVEDLSARIGKGEKESEEVYFDRLCEFLGKKFGGYSVYHVDGRFRMQPLSDRVQAAHLEINGSPYLMDETTAVSRFILPCDSHDEAELVWFFFQRLFIDSILQRVNGEVEIWMVEMGMFQRVWVWRVPSGASEDIEEEQQDGDLPI